jgi:hypothetical protein
MTTRFSCWFWLLPLVALLCGQAGVTPAQDDPKEVEKKLQVVRKQIEKLELTFNGVIPDAGKIQVVRKQIDELRQQEQVLLKLQEEQRKDQQKAEEEKKTQYAKVEIRGQLRRSAVNDWQGHSRLPPWQVSFGDLTWFIDFRQKKELLAAAKQLAGKPVALVGKVELLRDPLVFLSPMPVVMVESLKPAEK